jgi:hypothetical protein
MRVSTTGRVSSGVLCIARPLVRSSVAGVVMALWPAVAGAQDKDADAERLFREGQKLMEERRFGEACPKFDAAYRKDQQLGTLLNLAYCHKEQGAIWQAWLEFKEAELKAVEVKRPERKDFARQRMVELERSLARVVVDPPAKLELLEVLVEDRHVPDAEKGGAFAAEPGQRKFTFRAKGKKQATQLVSVMKSDRSQHVSVPEMEDQPQEPVVADIPAASPHVVDASAARGKDKKEASAATQKTVGLALGGLGVVGVGVGAVFGLMTFTSGCSSLSSGDCALAEREDASDKSVVSTVAFATGGVLVVAGLALWLTAPSARASATALRRETRPARNHRVVPEIGAGWAGLRGTF